MSTAVAVTAEACGTILALGAAAGTLTWRALSIAREALQDGSVRASVTLATVAKGKRFDWPAVKAPAADAADPAPASAAGPTAIGGRRTA